MFFTESDMSGNICELENTSTIPLETACFYLNGPAVFSVRAKKGTWYEQKMKQKTTVWLSQISE